MSSNPEVTLIAAVAENNVIGNGPDIPWRLSSDFMHFKRTTLGKPLIMGRKTFESIGKPLPGRTNIVVTRQTGYQPDGVLVIDSLEAAIAYGRAIAEADHVDAVMIAGGADIYRQAMDLADKLIISHVALSPEGDAHFPRIDPNVWEMVEELPVFPSEKDSSSYKIHVYARR